MIYKKQRLKAFKTFCLFVLELKRRIFFSLLGILKIAEMLSPQVPWEERYISGKIIKLFNRLRKHP